MSSPARQPSKRLKMKSVRMQEAEQGQGSSAARRMKSRGKRPSSSQEKGKEVAQERQHIPYFSEEHLTREYQLYYGNRELVTPRYAHVDWLHKIHPDLSTWMTEQKLLRLIAIRGMYYPNLIRAFYTAVKVDNDTGFLTATLKEEEVTITDDLWKDILGLENDPNGFIPTKPYLHACGLAFNKSEVFSSMMKNPARKIESRLSVSHLRLEYRMLHYLITWVILPRGSNHAQVFEDDLIVMWAFQQRYQINWVHMISDNMFKATRMTEFNLPYAAFLGEVLRRSKVPLEGEMEDSVGNENLIQDKHLRQMGYEQQGNTWTEKKKGEASTQEHQRFVPPVLPEDRTEGSQQSASFEDQVLSRLSKIEDSQEELKKYYHQIVNRLNLLEVPQADEEEEESETESEEAHDI